jgi:hypothetical protein
MLRAAQTAEGRGAFFRNFATQFANALHPFSGRSYATDVSPRMGLSGSVRGTDERNRLCFAVFARYWAPYWITLFNFTARKIVR